MIIQTLVQHWYEAVDDGSLMEKIQNAVSDVLGLACAFFFICGLVLATIIRSNIDQVFLLICFVNAMAMLIGLCASFNTRDKIQLYVAIFGPGFFFLVEWMIL